MEKYLLKELSEKSGKKSLFNAYQTNRAEVVRWGNFYSIIWDSSVYERGIPCHLEKTIKTQMGVYYPELIFIG